MIMKTICIILLSLSITTIGISQETAENTSNKEKKVVPVSNNEKKVKKVNSFEGINELNQKIKEQIKLPAIVRQEGIEGTVLVNVDLDAKGNIKKVVVLEGLHPEVDMSVKDTIYKIKKVQPIVFKGKATAKTIQLKVLVNS